MNTNSTPNLNPGRFKKIGAQISLTWKLFWNKRAPFRAKLVVVAGLIYLWWPGDLIPGLPFDDAAVLWFCSDLFISMCPKGLVNELRGKADTTADGEEIIDAEFEEK